MASSASEVGVCGFKCMNIMNKIGIIPSCTESAIFDELREKSLSGFAVMGFVLYRRGTLVSSAIRWREVWLLCRF